MEKDKPIIVAQIMGKWIGGGVEAVVMNYYRHIDRTKIQFDFICDEDSTNIPYDEIEKLGGRVIIVPPYQHIFAYLKKLKQIFKENKYKIVHSHINALSVFPLYAAKCAGVPVRIAHSHATSSKKEWKRNLIKNILRIFSKVNATDYMCCSELAGRWLFGDRLYDKGKVYLLNNAVNLEKFEFNEDVRKNIRKNLSIDNDKIVVGHVGRMVETKNHSFLFKVFKKFAENENSFMILVGQGGLENQLKKLANQMKIDDKVIFLGQKENVNQIYQAFDVFVLPSFYEGFGMVLLEAQMSNLPCVVSDTVPKNAKVIENFIFLSIEDEIEKWSSTIANMVKRSARKSNFDLLEKKGFNIKKEVKKLEKIYLNLYEEYKNA